MFDFFQIFIEFVLNAKQTNHITNSNKKKRFF